MPRWDMGRKASSVVRRESRENESYARGWIGVVPDGLQPQE